jgi:MFS family permease
MSGVHMLPMVLGMLFTSIGSGQIVSRTGRYRLFPIIGTAVVTVGLVLLSLLTESTSTLVMSLYFLVFGLGLGLVLQVLVLIVQNSVGYQDLGSATAAATFFRSIGASFGVSIFGTIFTTGLNRRLHDALRGVALPPGFTPQQITSDPRAVRTLPPAVSHNVLHAYASSIAEVFRYAAPVVAVAFVLALFIREQPLRESVTAPDLGESIGMNPVERSSVDEIARALTVLSTREARRDLYRRITAEAGLDLQPASSWLLLQMLRQGPLEPAELAENRIIPPAVVEAAAREVEGRGLARRNGLPMHLTETGERTARQLVAARRTQLSKLLGDWDEKQFADLATLLTTLSDHLCGDPHDRPDPTPAPHVPHSEGRSF